MKYSVVLVPFPFDDLLTTKVRPAVCLTDPVGPHSHIVLAFITSQLPAIPLSTDVLLDATLPDFAMTGLRVSSLLQVHRLMTVTRALLVRQLGSLSPAMQRTIEARLRMLFGLT